MSGVIRIAVLAVGGQGGGVLSNWIRALAEDNGFAAQMTSVAGVAQRTGATIYYIEMAKLSDRLPVFALSPSPGDVDILIAAEVMEAGRAAQRGFITPDRTTLIASTHRILAVDEKLVPGDGRGDAAAVLAELHSHASRVLAFDMETLAQKSGSVISASLFGALARSEALPFAPEAFEAVIATSGRGVKASIAAFRAALNYQAPEVLPPRLEASRDAARPTGPPRLVAKWHELESRLSGVATAARTTARAGLARTVDYQDLAYGAEYLDRLEQFTGHSEALDLAAARYLANAMCYDDILRVADLKTRSVRDARLRREQEIPGDGLVQVTEFFHPRVDEIVATLPSGLGRWVEARAGLLRLLARLTRRGRRSRTDRIGGFLPLWLVAGLRPYRRRLLRHDRECRHIERLMTRAAAELPARPELAAEILACQRLVKGYSDTHARGHSKFGLVMAGLERVANREDAADWLRRLRHAALEDEEGRALEGALATIESFALNPPPAGRAASAARA